MSARLPARKPPYPEPIQRLFQRFMPEGVPPILLFRVLAGNERIFPRFMQAGVLDRGPLSLRQRELAILRTSARCDAEYEWGVHVAGFARQAGISDAEVAATRQSAWDDEIWSPSDAAILRLCDELHDDHRLSDLAWTRLRDHFDEAQALELLYIAGMYTCIAYLVNGLRLPLEAFAPGFPRSEVGVSG